MKVSKTINNNIVSAYNDDGREIIVMGKGIGYRVHKGEIIPSDSIEKIFTMHSQNDTERLKELLASLPEECIEVTNEILSYAEKSLKKRLNEGVYITLADHINFALTRAKMGMDFQNVLHTEVRRFYSLEYAIGKYALELIENSMGISLPDDEAASIALHIFNAEYDISISDTFHATKMLDNILAIVTQEAGCVIDENNYFCERFITHLKFLTQRIIKKEALPKIDDDFSKFVSARYQLEMQCGKAIAKYVLSNYDYEISQEEVASLAIHIRRIGSTFNATQEDI